MEGKIFTLEDVLKGSEKQGNLVVNEDQYLYNGQPVPKEWGWVIVLSTLVKRGFKLKLTYNGRGQTDFPIFVWDPEMKGIAPMVPKKCEIYKVETIQKEDELSNVFGPKVITNERKIAEIHDEKSLLDPDPELSMTLFDLMVV